MVLAAACQVEAPVSLGRSAEGIVGGTDDTTHRAVVAITSPQNPNASYCTGTLIAPTVVVTAAHCVLGAESHDADLFAYFGDVVGDGGTSIAVIEAVAHPSFSLSQSGSAYDVGLLRLASPAPVSPLAFGAAPVTGTPATLVGFGYDTTEETGIGTRRQRAQVIGTVTPGDFVLVDSGSCDGDSGGAVLIEGASGPELVGVHSNGSCGGTSREARIDLVQASFVVPFIDAAAGGAGGAGGGSGGATTTTITSATSSAATSGAGGAGGDGSIALPEDGDGCAVSMASSRGGTSALWAVGNCLILMNILRRGERRGRCLRLR